MTTPPTTTCTCPEPRPVQVAERKGAARTLCARCHLPIPLRLRSLPAA